MNNLDTIKISDKTITPFYAWDCITLNLPHRDVDLIIRKEE